MAAVAEGADVLEVSSDPVDSKGAVLRGAVQGAARGLRVVDIESVPSAESCRVYLAGPSVTTVVPEELDDVIAEARTRADSGVVETVARALAQAGFAPRQGMGPEGEMLFDPEIGFLAATLRSARDLVRVDSWGGDDGVDAAVVRASATACPPGWTAVAGSALVAELLAQRPGRTHGIGAAGRAEPA